MNVVLWVVAALLAAAFLAAGLTKLARPKAALAAQMAWVEDFPQPVIKLIGGSEVLAAIGLIVPAAVGIAPILVPLAATGLVIVMIGAAVTHARRHEPQMIATNVVLLVLAAFVVWGRFGPYSF